MQHLVAIPGNLRGDHFAVKAYAAASQAVLKSPLSLYIRIRLPYLYAAVASRAGFNICNTRAKSSLFGKYISTPWAKQIAPPTQYPWLPLTHIPHPFGTS